MTLHLTLRHYYAHNVFLFSSLWSRWGWWLCITNQIWLRGVIGKTKIFKSSFYNLATCWNLLPKYGDSRFKIKKTIMWSWAHFSIEKLPLLSFTSPPFLFTKIWKKIAPPKKPLTNYTSIILWLHIPCTNKSMCSCMHKSECLYMTNPKKGWHKHSKLQTLVSNVKSFHGF